MQKFNSCNKFRLVRPNITYESQWQYAVNVLQKTDGKIVPSNLVAPDFCSFLEQTQNFAVGRNLPAGYVPSELYFFVNENDISKIIGVTDLRLATTPAIEQFFGHAGGCILPEYRNMGLGKHIIALTLDKLRQKGFKYVIFTIESGNEKSRCATISNGGRFLGVSFLEGKKIERYQIDLYKDWN